MPSWNELLDELQSLSTTAAAKWITEKQTSTLREIGKLRGDTHVILYASGFLQKPQAPAPLVQITHEDLNGFMSVMYGMTWNKGLTLLIHTPGGVTNATETIVSYLWSKFEKIEAIVPAFAMSAGTMISLATDKIVMGRQSQLGPIDPQFILPSGACSAQAIVDQFKRAKSEILEDLKTAHAWAPILQSMGPALLQEAQNALSYSKSMVTQWLMKRMFKAAADPQSMADATASHFSDAGTHRSHGRRIDRDEARQKHVVIEELETNQTLQEHVLTAYHLATLTFEKTPAAKFLASDTGRFWIKNWQ